MQGFTHIEVAQANEGAKVWGLTDGVILTVTKETPKFYFARSHAGAEIKISKLTKRCCHWKNQNTSPLFNI